MKVDLTEEEKLILNHLAVDDSLSMCLHRIQFAIQAAPDKDTKDALKGTFEKVKKFTEEEFKEMTEYLPFPVIMDEEEPFFDESWILSEDETEPVTSIPHQAFLNSSR